MEDRGLYTVETEASAMRELSECMTLYQAHLLVCALRNVMLTGYGEVTLCVENGALYVKTTTSQAAGKLPR